MGTKGSWWQQLAEGTAKPHGQRREPAQLWGRVPVPEHTPIATICCCFFLSLPTLLPSSRPNFPRSAPRAPRCPSFLQPLSCSCCHSHVLSSSSAPADAHGCATDPLTRHVGVSELLHPQKLASAFGQCAICCGEGDLAATGMDTATPNHSWDIPPVSPTWAGLRLCPKPSARCSPCQDQLLPLQEAIDPPGASPLPAL